MPTMTKTLQTEADFNAAITEARAAYHAIVDTGNRHDVAAATALVSALQADREAFLARGAKLCGTCQNAPLGMLKRPEVWEHGQLKSGVVYAIACRKCQTYETGSSPDKAAARWNEKRA
jgi:hypothetical protein